MRSVIDEWFGDTGSKNGLSIIGFGLSNKVLVSRLKKILLYRLQEARMLASDFYSKMDFYSSMEFELLSTLNQETCMSPISAPFFNSFLMVRSAHLQVVIRTGLVDINCEY
jgi:hypothetical protein